MDCWTRILLLLLVSYNSTFSFVLKLNIYITLTRSIISRCCAIWSKQVYHSLSWWKVDGSIAKRYREKLWSDHPRKETVSVFTTCKWGFMTCQITILWWPYVMKYDQITSNWFACRKLPTPFPLYLNNTVEYVTCYNDYPLSDWIQSLFQVRLKLVGLTEVESMANLHSLLWPVK